MKYCPYCGTKLQRNLKSCPSCGHQLAKVETPKGFGAGLVSGGLASDEQNGIQQLAQYVAENLAERTGQHELGPVLHTHGTSHICEGGVSDDRKSILWDEVESLFLSAWKRTVNYIAPAGEGMEVRIVSMAGDKITFTQDAIFRIGNKDKSSFWDLYQFIVSQVIERQWSKLVNDIEERKRVTFGDFDISSSAIYRKKFFGGYDIIDLRLVAGCHFANGEFVLDFVDDKGRVKRKTLGSVARIPNIHLAEAFLSSIAQNSGIK
jgi:hypothetical protein